MIVLERQLPMSGCFSKAALAISSSFLLQIAAYATALEFPGPGLQFRECLALTEVAIWMFSNHRPNDASPNCVIEIKHQAFLADPKPQELSRRQPFAISGTKSILNAMSASI